MSEVLKLTIPGNPEYIKIAKMAVGSAASLRGLDMDGVSDLQTAVAEACRIVTCHGFPGWSTTYDIVCEVSDAQMKVKIEDIVGEHCVEKEERLRCPGCPDEGDVGLNMIEYMMDKVEISKAEQGCKSITITKNLKK